METKTLRPVTEENTREFVTNFSILYPDKWERVVSIDTFETDVSRYTTAHRLYPEESEGIIYSMLTERMSPEDAQRVIDRVKAEEAQNGQVWDNTAMARVPAHQTLTVQRLPSRRPRQLQRHSSSTYKSLRSKS